MLLAYSGNAWTQVSAAEGVRRSAALGYDGVEVLLDAPHLFPPATGDAEVEALRRTVDDAGVVVVNANGNTARGFWTDPPDEGLFEPSLNHPDPAVRARRIDCVRRGLEIAHALGSPALSVASGRIHPATPPDRAFALLVESLGPIMERAHALGVRVGIEPEPALLVETTVEALEVADRVGSDLLGLNLDLGHAHCAGEDLAARIPEVTPRVWNVHIEDIAGGKHYHLVPGDGDMDLPGLVGALAAAGYDRSITVELYTCTADPDGAGARALAHLRPHLA